MGFKGRFGVRIVKIICLSIVLVSGLLFQNDLLAHGSNESCEVNYLPRYEAFLGALVEEFEKELQRLDISAEILAQSISHGSIIQNALQTYHTKSADLKIEKKFTPVNRSWFGRQIKSFLYTGSSVAEQTARFGVLFGLAWAGFEFIEHSIIHLPVGFGPLCAVFPAVWTATVMPLIEPISHLKLSIEDRTYLSRLKTGWRSHFTSRRIRSNLEKAELRGLLIRRSDQIKHSQVDDPIHHVLMATKLWKQSLMFFIGEKIPAHDSVVSKISESLKLNRAPELSDVIEFDLLMQIPVQIFEEITEFMYFQNKLNFFELSSLKFKMGRLSRNTNHFIRTLSYLSHLSNIKEGGRHAEAVVELFSEYISIISWMKMNSSFNKTQRKEFSELILDFQRKVRGFEMGCEMRLVSFATNG